MSKRRVPLLAAAAAAVLLAAGLALAVSEEAFQLNEEGITLLRAGKYTQAKEKFLAAVATDSVYSEARINAARAAEMENPPDWETVKTEYLTVLTYEPENLDALVGIGEYYVKTPNPEEAKPHFDAALELDPRSGAAHFGLGNMHHKMKKTQQAKAEYEKAVAADPRGFPRAFLRLGLYEYDAGEQTKNFTKAIEHLEKYVAMKDDDDGLATGRRRLGAIYIQKNDAKKAIEHLTKAKELSPSDPWVSYYLGEAHSKAGNLSAAEKEYLACVEKDPKFGEAHFKLAVLYQQDEMDEKAIAHYKAAAADPSFRQKGQAAQMAKQLEEYLRKVRQETGVE
ncbi:MAG: tetratricopeptide repeat protein [Candidatus Eisenbacteria bacterium]